MEQQARKMKTPKESNGVNVDELFGTIEAVKSAAVIAKFRFRANNQWIEGITMSAPFAQWRLP